MIYPVDLSEKKLRKIFQLKKMKQIFFVEVKGVKYCMTIRF